MPSKKRSQPRAASATHAPRAAAATGLLPTPKAALPVAPLALPPLDSEWLETDGLGGFASGTVSGIRTRRYHALLLAATKPPEGRVVLVNGVDARVTTPDGSFDLSSNRYGPEVIHPDGYRRIESFAADPWPTWVYRLEDGIRIEQQIFTVHGAPGVILTWRVIDGSAAGVRLMVRPLISGRDAQALHHQNPHFRSEAMSSDSAVRWHPYAAIPAILAGSNGRYAHHHLWYHNFLYEDDRARGLDHYEDLVSPGTFHFDLSRGEAVLVLTTDEGLKMMKAGNVVRAAGLPGFVAATSGDPDGALEALRESERANRHHFPTPLHRAADSYVTRRGDGVVILPGYPALRESSREAFASLRGLCLATGRIDEARQILLSWAETLSEGMFPTRFPNGGEPPAYESVDAPLWFITAVHELIQAAAASRRRVPSADRKVLQTATGGILMAYVQGTRHRIRMDEDGLLAAGDAGARLTWMDSALEPEGFPARIGKPVEVQALWLNALRIGSELSPEYGEWYERGRGSFERRFWNESGGCLYDLVDVGHERGTAEAALRANQILAVGGLPFPVLEGARARGLLDLVEKRLLTPVGLRAAAPDETAGTTVAGAEIVWPWLLGPFIEGWVRVRGNTPEAKTEARERFLDPLREQVDHACLGHIPEAMQADPPYALRGSPFYGWSVGEALRLDRVVLQA